ncbi:MAG: alginate export family protein [Porticoccus sp.]|nr:alginate export family protein [Porticoccus sp.]
MKNAVVKKPKCKLLTAAMSVIIVGFTGHTLANEQLTLEDAIKGGKLDINFRYRFENVDDDARPEEAHASTLRSRLTYTTKTFSDFQVGLEVDDVSVVGGENYDDLNGNNTDHAVVADPEGTEVNQVWIAYTGIDNTSIKAGRQRINLDNQRFVGGVGWRQNEQTYDSVTVVNSSLKDTTFFYAFVDNVNRIFGPNDGRTGTPAADVDWDSSANILNLNYKGLGFGTLSAYAYLLDLDDAPAMSTKTFGARFSGSQGDKTKLLYTAEYARQSDYEDNPNSYDADYYTLEGGVQAKGVTATLGIEVLGSDDNKGAFSTPLATLHKFQGFADKFLSTPGDGIEDVYASVFTNVLGAKVGVIYHDFEAEEGNTNYGDEIDLVIAKQLHKNIHLLFKYANYNAENFGTDTEKAWLQLTINF